MVRTNLRRYFARPTADGCFRQETRIRGPRAGRLWRPGHVQRTNRRFRGLCDSGGEVEDLLRRIREVASRLAIRWGTTLQAPAKRARTARLPGAVGQAVRIWRPLGINQRGQNLKAGRCYAKTRRYTGHLRIDTGTSTRPWEFGERGPRQGAGEEIGTARA